MKPTAGPGSRTAAAKDHRRRRYKPNPTLNPPSLASFRVEISVDRTVQLCDAAGAENAKRRPGGGRNGVLEGVEAERFARVLRLAFFAGLAATYSPAS